MSPWPHSHALLLQTHVKDEREEIDVENLSRGGGKFHSPLSVVQ